MSYIEKKFLEAAITQGGGLIDTTTDFWTLLSVLQSIDIEEGKEVESGKSYQFDIKKAGAYLDSLFCLDNKSNSANSGQEMWYAKFANGWAEKGLTKGKEKLCTNYIVAWALRKENINGNGNDIVDAFVKKFHLNKNVLDNPNPNSIQLSAQCVSDTEIIKIFNDENNKKKTLIKENKKLGNVVKSGSNIKMVGDGQYELVKDKASSIQKGAYIKPFFNKNYNNQYLIITTYSIDEVYGPSKFNCKTEGMPLQQIFYGAPGSGKSHKVKLYESAFAKVIRTTFHPDSDYTSFVGTYKPVMVDEILWAPDRGFYPTDARVLKLSDSNDPNRKFDPKKISYEFTPQAFVNAYVEAWKLFSEAFNSSKESEEIEFKNVLLNIEEINRGNCAQIFGDIFQLLDRNRNGVSEYPIVSDYALKQYLEGQFQGLSIDCIDGFYEDKYTSPINEFHTRAKDIKEGNVLILPPNLYIWATMNTSDQSLFPMDSAFKRRWEWEYVPVDHEDAKRFHIFIGGKSYNWDTFISVVNKKIFGATQSADKQLGNRFCKPDATIGIDSDSVEHYMISTKQFMGKVMFYLWEEVCKDAPEEESINFMRICEKLNNPANPVSSEYFSFQELYEGKDYKNIRLRKEAILQMFMNYLNVPEETNISNINSSIGSLLDFEKNNTNNQDIEECDLGKIFVTSDGGSDIDNSDTEDSETPEPQE